MVPVVVLMPSRASMHAVYDGYIHCTHMYQHVFVALRVGISKVLTML